MTDNQLTKPQMKVLQKVLWAVSDNFKFDKDYNKYVFDNDVNLTLTKLEIKSLSLAAQKIEMSREIKIK